MLDAIGYFKLWGVSEEAMLFDPVRGGLIVRGAATHNNPLDGPDRQAGTYVAFYAATKAQASPLGEALKALSGIPSLVA
ncbi:MAG: hypothetical protein QHH75_13790 [Bacillota bacterium]|jgi:hypothetical protein|nr:hypothetical protein [Bacillota bacterium]